MSTVPLEKKNDAASAVELLRKLRAPLIHALLDHTTRFPETINEPKPIDPREGRLFPREDEEDLPPPPPPPTPHAHALSQIESLRSITILCCALWDALRHHEPVLHRTSSSRAQLIRLRTLCVEVKAMVHAEESVVREIAAEEAAAQEEKAREEKAREEKARGGKGSPGAGAGAGAGAGDKPSPIRKSLLGEQGSRPRAGSLSGRGTEAELRVHTNRHPAPASFGSIPAVSPFESVPTLLDVLQYVRLHIGTVGREKGDARPDTGRGRAPDAQTGKASGNGDSKAAKKSSSLVLTTTAVPSRDADGANRTAYEDARAACKFLPREVSDREQMSDVKATLKARAAGDAFSGPYAHRSGLVQHMDDAELTETGEFVINSSRRPAVLAPGAAKAAAMAADAASGGGGSGSGGGGGGGGGGGNGGGMQGSDDTKASGAATSSNSFVPMLSISNHVQPTLSHIVLRAHPAASDRLLLRAYGNHLPDTCTLTVNGTNLATRTVQDGVCVEADVGPDKWGGDRGHANVTVAGGGGVASQPLSGGFEWEGRPVVWGGGFAEGAWEDDNDDDDNNNNNNNNNDKDGGAGNGDVGGSDNNDNDKPSKSKSKSKSSVDNNGAEMATVLVRGGGFEPPGDLPCTVRFGGYGAEQFEARLLAGGTKIVASVPRQFCVGHNIAVTVFAGYVPSIEFLIPTGLPMTRERGVMNKEE